MNKNNDFDDLNKNFNELSKNFINILDSLSKKIESFDKTNIVTQEIIELIETYKNKITLEEE